MLCIRCEAETNSEDACDACGEDPLVEGRYRVLELLGRGANGTTYRAERLSDGEVVALKELLVRNAESLKTLELFEREAKVLEQLDHPNIPSYVEDFTVTLGPNVGMYIAQDFVDGRPLSDFFGEDRLPVARVLRAVRDVAAVLDYLHGLSPPVVHRDLKPGNILRKTGGTIAVIDFGAVQDALGAGADDGVPTMAGTIGYMAPEQLLGRAEPASDVYALGATAAALLAGKPAGEALADEDWQSAVPEEIGTLLREMLAAAARNRPLAGSVAKRLDDLLPKLEEQVEAIARREGLVDSMATTPRPLPSDFNHPAENTKQVAGLVVGVSVLIGAPFGLMGGPIAALVVIGLGLCVSGAVLATSFFSQKRVQKYREWGCTVGELQGADLRYIYYAYEVEGRRFRSKTAHGTHHNVRAGSDILVFYDPSDPSHSHPLPYFVAGAGRLV